MTRQTEFGDLGYGDPTTVSGRLGGTVTDDRGGGGVVLSAIGGFGGTVLGVIVTGGYAATQEWPTVVPPWAMLGGVGATLVIGALAGLYPAIRAARLSPTDALAVP